MTHAGLVRVLTSLGISSPSATDQFQLKTLDSINLNADGNHVCNSMTDFLMFDLTNDLIKIKEKTYTVESGLFASQWSISSEGKISFYGDNPIRENSFFKFRYPKNGDIIFFVNRKTGKILTTHYSLSLVNGSFSLSNYTYDETLLSSTYFMGYADAGTFSDTSQALIEPTVLLKYSNKTNYPADIYIDLSNVVGFTFANGKYGN
jgi:hypothetical protein